MIERYLDQEGNETLDEGFLSGNMHFEIMHDKHQKGFSMILSDGNDLESNSEKVRVVSPTELDDMIDMLQEMKEKVKF